MRRRYVIPSEDSKKKREWKQWELFGLLLVCLTVAALYVVAVAKISKTLAADAVPLETERYRFGRLRVTSANNMAVTSSDATTGGSAGAVTEVTAMLAKPAMPGEFKTWL